MTTYAQSTIHSKIAKLEKVNDPSMGHVVKGTITNFGNSTHKHVRQDPDVLREIQILPRNKLNIARKLKNKRVIPGANKNQQIILMESSIFPAIYFKKTTMRNVLKQFQFPENCEGLPSEDERTTHIYQIITNLFNEINFYIFNILIGENLITRSYYVFFSDSQTIPFTKCCNAPVFIQLLQNGSGKIMCNSANCKHSNLAQFLINFDDGRKLWNHITYFTEASYKDKQLKNKISKLILNGKYKKKSLVNMVQDTSKEIVDLFYLSKQQERQQEEISILDNQQETPFLTATGNHHNSISSNKTDNNNQDQSNVIAENEEEMLLEPGEKNIETLKMKLMYITKMQNDAHKKISKKIVQDGKVFHKNFDMIRRIDQLTLKNRNNKNTSKISFPRLMSQVKRMEESERARQKSMRKFDNSSIL